MLWRAAAPHATQLLASGYDIHTIQLDEPATAIGLGAYTLYRFRSRLNFLAAVGMCLGILNYYGSCLFYGIVYED